MKLIVQSPLHYSVVCINLLKLKGGERDRERERERKEEGRGEEGRGGEERRGKKKRAGEHRIIWRALKYFGVSLIIPCERRG
jgi:hypothetical protein